MRIHSVEYRSVLRTGGPSTTSATDAPAGTRTDKDILAEVAELDDLGYDTEGVSVDLRERPGEESDSERSGGRAGDEAESVDPTGPVTLEIEEQHLGAAVDFLG